MAAIADFGNLNSVVLGVADNYIPHLWAWKNDGVSNENFKLACKLADSVITDQIRTEVIEDLDNFEKQLLSLNIRTYRPPRILEDSTNESKNFLSYGNDYYNMRDLQIVLDNIMLTASPACPPRLFEVSRLTPFLKQVAIKENLKIMNCPLPILESNPVEEFFYNGTNLEPAENLIGRELGGDYPDIWHRLKEDEMLFDAANIARFGNKLIYLISSTGNKSAYDWLKEEFSDKYFITYTDVYRSSHIDSTIIPLEENCVLVNAKRVDPSNLPKLLESKQVIYFDDVADIPNQERIFHSRRKEFAERIRGLGFHSNLWEMSSPWAGLNVLVIRNNLVAVESRQESLINELEKRNFEVLPVKYRHPYTFLGGLHCTTLDLDRS